MNFKRLVLVPVILLSLLTCEDTLTPLIQEDVRVAQLPERALNILPPANGSVTPVGTITVKDNEPQNLAATPNAGFTFVNWIQTAGTGTALFADVNAAGTSVRLTGGNATIQPIISDIIWDLTVNNDGHGTTSPSGVIPVANTQPRAIVATPNAAAGYEFKDWTQTSGPGAASFDNETSASTNVTLTGGHGTIQANFQLKHYSVTMTNDTHGTTSPSGILDLTHGVASASISTTPATGYRFKNWTVTVGSGITFTPNSTTTPVTITAAGGNATVQANFELIPYTLTVTNDTHGYTSPSGATAVSYGVPRAIQAYPYGTYKFNNWTQTAGAGTVTFSPNANSASATATVTGGDVAIRANFVKESVSLTEVGTLTFSNTTTYPNEVDDVYFYNNYLYVIGSYASTSSVVRRFNLASPAAPSSGTEDYRYVSGASSALIGDGTYLFAGTTSTGGNIYRYPITTFGPGATQVAASPAAPVTDLAIHPAAATYLWGATGTTVKEFDKSLYTGNYIINPDAGSFTYLEKTPFELLAIQDDNNAHQMSSYDVDATAGATWNAPDSTIAVHAGGDMDPGNAGRIQKHVDGEWVAVPVYYSGYYVRTYGVDDPYGIYYMGQAALSGEARFLSLDDYYIYVGADQTGSAYVYIVDAAVPSAPVVRTSFQVSGFEWVDAVYVNGSYLYVIVDSASASKPTLKVFQITKS